MMAKRLVSSPSLSTRQYLSIGQAVILILLAAGFVFQANDSRRATKQHRADQDELRPKQSAKLVKAEISKPVTIESRGSSNSLFNNAFAEMYKKVTEGSFSRIGKEQNEDDLNNISGSLKRHSFNVSQWTRKTSGGLEDEDRSLVGELYYNATSLFEFGLGESTYIAAETNVPRYTGVDSDPHWVAKAREGATAPPTLNLDAWEGQEIARKGAHFRFHFADIGPTGRWGYPIPIRKGDPVHKGLRANFNIFNYQFAALQVESKPFDVYMVDGRYRTACAILCFLHAMCTGGDLTQIKVAVHDKNRPERGYDTLLSIADVTRETRKLWILELKPNISEKELYEIWKQNAYNKV